jgi:hypothetical protein
MLHIVALRQVAHRFVTHEFALGGKGNATQPARPEQGTDETLNRRD